MRRRPTRRQPGQRGSPSGSLASPGRAMDSRLPAHHTTSNHLPLREDATTMDMTRRSWTWLVGLALLASVPLPLPAAAQARGAARSQPQAIPYYPGPGENWEHRAPEQVGMDPRLLDDAIAFAKANESRNPRDLALEHEVLFGREPHSEGIGPFKPRGEMTGVILRHGYIVTEWGEPARVDMTFSMTKSFLSTTVGLAYDRELIRDLNQPVRVMVPTDEFASEHNRRITWTTCCGRPATGKAPCGASRIGPIARPPTCRWPSTSTARTPSPAPPTSTTTRG
jgi:hypothetical protein